MSILSQINKIITNRGSCYAVLIDPDKKNKDLIQTQVEAANNADVDFLFIGGSLMMDSKFPERVKQIKLISNIPIILFPGNGMHINSFYDAILFMSVLSGRNPHYLIGEQVITAPIIKDLDIETISTGYILIDCAAQSSVEFMSGTKPIPMKRTDIAVAHALAGQYLGMDLIYLEAGSGAKYPVPLSMIEAVGEAIDKPLIVGGGINTPEKAEKAVESGASIIVTGNAIENNFSIMNEFSDAIHTKK